MKLRPSAFDSFEAQKVPQNIEKWSIGQAITRENAVHFLKQSFILSRGRMELQQVMLREFIQAGYLTNVEVLLTLIESLSHEELQLLVDSYNATPQHGRDTAPESLKRSLQTQITEIITLEKEKFRVLYFIELVINPDFRKKAKHLKKIIRTKIKTCTPAAKP